MGRTHFVYLHGFLSSPSSRKAHFFAERLARHGLPLRIPDLNGPDFSQLTITGQLKEIARLVATLQGDLVLIGSSLGGYLACLFAQQEPRVRKLVLMAPAFEFYQRQVQLLGREGLQRWKSEGYLELFHYGWQKTCRLSYAFLEDAAHYQSVQFTRDLPALLFHGVQDEVVPYGLSVDYVANHQQSSLVLLPSDHQLLDVLERVWLHTAAFLGLR